METIVQSKTETAADGRKIVRVQFSPQVPNPASQSDVEVIFEVQRSDTALGDDPYAIIGPLSVTLTDTREHYILSRNQRQAVIEAALAAVLQSDGYDW